jgi:CRISPR-associated endonuclease/helicase Cas3
MAEPGPRRFHAHSTEFDETTWQPLSVHLHQVGTLAAEAARPFGADGLAMVAGLLHDLGKYTEDFQARIRGGTLRVDHSTWGARIAVERFGAMGRLLAYGIAGHHAGMANGRGEGTRTPLEERMRASLPVLDPVWEQEVSLPDQLLLPASLRTFGNSRQEAQERHTFQIAFLSRMVFSCLVDADFLDTEAFYLQGGGEAHDRRHPTPSLAELREELDTHLEAKSGLPGEVNDLRRLVLQAVRAGASRCPGLFSLTVPTGGGKTLSSLAFALDHAIRHGLRRVIYVIPFTSVVEQNAAVFRRALGPLGQSAVLEHHSAFVDSSHDADDPEHYQAKRKLGLAMENWDAPIVVTTAVQFFESLFAARPSQCRKLHNISGSVVIVDEAQTMPLKLLRPCVAALDELARNYRTSVVLCTATQPALQSPEFKGGLPVTELAPDPAGLFRRLERVRVTHKGPLADGDLAREMRSRAQVLCIVNNRRHARAVYEAIADLPGARHLSTLMCARHRSQVLTGIRQLLRDGAPCRLVSTSLIEAGVDVDFPAVLRAEAGLDSIAQAAGRCNREGRRSPAESEVLVFATENADWAPPTELRQYAQVAREVLRQVKGDPLSPDAIRRYFELLYWQKGNQELDAPNLLGLLRESRIDSLPLETMATKFRMVDSVQVPVLIPYDDEARRSLSELEFAQGSVGLARRLQPYLVQLPRQGFDALYKAGAVAPVAPEKWGMQFMSLVNPDLYDAQTGLSWSDPTYMHANSMVI